MASSMSEGSAMTRLVGDENCCMASCRGVLALLGKAVDQAASAALARGVVPGDWQEKRLARDGAEGFHVSFLVKSDLQRLADSLRQGGDVSWLEELPAEIPKPSAEDASSLARAAAALVAAQPTALRWVPLGIGKAQDSSSEAYFIAIAWPAGQAARRKLGLAPQDFHISLGFSNGDVHGCSKGIPSLISGAIDMEACAAAASLARAVADVGVGSVSATDAAEAMSLAAAALEASSAASADQGSAQASSLEAMCLLAGQMKRPTEVLEHAQRLLDLDATNEVGLRSKAFALVILKRYREAAPVLEAATMQLHQIADAEEQSAVQEKLQKCVELCSKRAGLIASPPVDSAFQGQQFTDDDFDREFLEEQKLKFPSTAHLKNLGGATKEDKICDELRQKFFCGSGNMVIVEEKVDGANLGISLDSLYRPRLQGRSKYVNWKTDDQFSGLEQWLEDHRAALCELLERNRHILFGEWCQCLHTVKYTRLPGYFIAFDIFDRAAGKFLSRTAVHSKLLEVPAPKIPMIPVVAHRQFGSMSEVEALLQRSSAFGDGFLEGVYLRVDEARPSPGADMTYLQDRCKLVRADFRQAVDTEGSWRGRGRNRLDLEFAQAYVEQCYSLASSSGDKASASAVSASAPASSEAGRGNYPSTPHLPFSPGVHEDDIKLTDGGSLVGCEVIVTEKLDGGNCCIKEGQVYARTHSQPATHESFSSVKQLVHSFPIDLEDVELFGENMTAIHSIEYRNLQSYFYVFGARKGGEWLSWDEVTKLADQLQLPTVPLLFKGKFESVGQMQQCLERWAQEPSAVGTDARPEGFVVRLPGRMVPSAFQSSIAKFVRASHIQTDATWRRKWRKAVLGEAIAARPLRTLDANPLRARLSDPRIRHKCSVPDLGEVELQRNFSFILDDVAVSSTPKKAEQVQAMASLGIALVVTLTEETPLPPEWFAGTTVTNMFVPVTNYEPPSVEQVDNIIAAILTTVAAGGKAMVHCGGGKGRAGTVAACLMLRFGDSSIAAGSVGKLQCRMRSDEVISYLRDIRPGSIETSIQERFIREYASLLWRRAAEDSGAGDGDEWEANSQLEADACIAVDLFDSASSASGAGGASSSAAGRGKSSKTSLKSRQAEQDHERRRKEVAKRAPKYVVMVGMAGAGKSTFSKSLEASGCWVRANQDDFKRKGFESLLSDTVPLVRQGRTHLVVDRCNLTRAERAEVLDMLRSPAATDVVCVFFDIAVEDCKRRAAARENHPTIRKGGGARIIEAQARTIEKPEKTEGFAAVETVRSFAEAAALLQRYGVDDTAYTAEAADMAEATGTVTTVPEGDSSTAPQDESVAASEVVGLSESELPEEFALWLRTAMQEELPEQDVEAMFAAVEVILANAAEDAEAVPAACEILVDAGAPSCAARLEDRWNRSR